MSTPALDVEAVAAFLQAAELSSFTRAAEALGSTQSLVSTRIKRLETTLGKLLLQRHPRLVRLTSEGERFLPAARAFLSAHNQALAIFSEAPERIAIGISEQAAGADVPALLSRLAARDPGLIVNLRIEPSSQLEQAYEAGDLDAVLVRRIGAGNTGEVLREDGLGWFASPALTQPGDAPLPVISLVAECRLRQHAVNTLNRHAIDWREAFIGGGMAAVQAALTGGLGVAALATRVAPPGAVDIGAAWGLPALGRSHIVLRSNAATARGRAFVRELAAAFRG
ncbi:LysR family transcriptional regulator [Hyphomicrobiales bacterium]|nr:LysR family transcriptional regulator [Hyphomicrobiales bacterium]CAH1700342.1 LysR family transcriptional regulator [Hyphomicrobiales bacterium]CAI0344223.1 LysR family transcriptional regulator [Hyphomicrobiales bacterium]